MQNIRDNKPCLLNRRLLSTLPRQGAWDVDNDIPAVVVGDANAPYAPMSPPINPPVSVYEVSNVSTGPVQVSGAQTARGPDPRRRVCVAGVEASSERPKCILRHHQVVNYRDKRKYHATLMTRARCQKDGIDQDQDQDLEVAAECELSKTQKDALTDRHWPARARRVQKMISLLPDLMGGILQGHRSMPRTLMQRIQHALRAISPSPTTIQATLRDMANLTAQAVILQTV